MTLPLSSSTSFPTLGLLVALTAGGAASNAAAVNVNCGNTSGDANVLNTAIRGSATHDH